MAWKHLWDKDLEPLANDPWTPIDFSQRNDLHQKPKNIIYGMKHME